MEIKLTILPHQTKCIESIASVFDSVNMVESDESSANPIFSKDDITLKNNIEKIQSGLYESVILVLKMNLVLMLKWRQEQVRLIVIQDLCMNLISYMVFLSLLF